MTAASCDSVVWRMCYRRTQLGGSGDVRALNAAWHNARAAKVWYDVSAAKARHEASAAKAWHNVKKLTKL